MIFFFFIHEFLWVSISAFLCSTLKKNVERAHSSSIYFIQRNATVHSNSNKHYVIAKFSCWIVKFSGRHTKLIGVQNTGSPLRPPRPSEISEKNCST